MKAIYKQPGKSKLKVKGCVELCMDMVRYILQFLKWKLNMQFK